MEILVDHLPMGEAPLLTFIEGQYVSRAVLYPGSIQDFLQELQCPSKKQIFLYWTEAYLQLSRANGELHLSVRNRGKIGLESVVDSQNVEKIIQELQYYLS